MTRSFHAARLLVFVLVFSGLATLSGCSLVSPSDAQSGSAAQSAEVVMSGDYILNEDGTLRKPHVTPSVPTMDKAALQFNEIGAAQAAYQFVELVEYAWTTGDTQPLRDFSEERCTFCQSTIEQIQTLYEQGGWVNGMRLTVTEKTLNAPIDETTPKGSEYANSYAVSQVVETSEFDFFASGRLNHNPAARNTMELFIHWIGSDWKVAAGRILDESE